MTDERTLSLREKVRRLHEATKGLDFNQTDISEEFILSLGYKNRASFATTLDYLARNDQFLKKISRGRYTWIDRGNSGQTSHLRSVPRPSISVSALPSSAPLPLTPAKPELPARKIPVSSVAPLVSHIKVVADKLTGDQVTALGLIDELLRAGAGRFYQGRISVQIRASELVLDESEYNEFLAILIDVGVARREVGAEQTEFEVVLKRFGILISQLTIDGRMPTSYGSSDLSEGIKSETIALLGREYEKLALQARISRAERELGELTIQLDSLNKRRALMILEIAEHGHYLGSLPQDNGSIPTAQSLTQRIISILGGSKLA